MCIIVPAVIVLLVIVFVVICLLCKKSKKPIYGGNDIEMNNNDNMNKSLVMLHVSNIN